ncbi:MAG: DUF4389 domain-containing protein [Pseudolysinimonas sp.]
MNTPIRLEATLARRLSRWLWLVKMFLAIPHFVILAGLAVAFIITTLIAGVAILVKGSYPRALFDFNLGVLRWNWRVGFYVYAGLGTDTYPPFSLARHADYPASFEVDYDPKPSRPLVLAKWLLAVPHLVIVAVLMGDWFSLQHPSQAATGAFSILNILVVIAGVFLLITGRYPRPLFEFLLGLNRWVYRVLAYVAFMRDEYPPFRLDTDAHPDASRALD